MQFRTGEVIECREFKLTLYTTGNLTLECTASFTVDFARILRRHNEGYNPFHLITASFAGTTSDNGGTVQITEAALDLTTFQADRYASFDQARSEYVVNLDSTCRIIKNCLYEGWNIQSNLGLTKPNGNWIVVGKMTFPLILEVTINYESVNHGDIVSAIWGLANLQFAGCERYVKILELDSFKVNIDRRTFIIYHADDYKQKIEQLTSSAGVDITANVTAATRRSELPEVEFTLEKACVLLSFATMNWVTTLFKDVIRDGRLVSTTLLPHFTLPFQKAYHLIDPRDENNCLLRKFVETGYNNYTKLENDFRLFDVIEYYVSAARGHSTENQFTIAYLALNTLASMATNYAEKNGDNKLEQKKMNTVKTAEKKIRDSLSNNQKNLPDGVIHAIADKLAHKQIQDYDKMEYLIDEFEVDFDKPTLRKVVSFRGRFMHTGKDHNDEVREHYLTTLGALERTLLTMLGWKRNEYIDKLSDFTVKTLN